MGDGYDLEKLIVCDGCRLEVIQIGLLGQSGMCDLEAEQYLKLWNGK